MAHSAHDSVPIWASALPIAATLMRAGILPAEARRVLIAAGLLLAGSVFAVVHHAEILALRLSKPFGSIVLNGVVGLCLVVGAQRHHEQSFRPDGAVTALGVLGTLAVLSLVMPNFTEAVEGPICSPGPLMVVGLVFVQMIGHRDYFLDVAAPSGGRAISDLDRPSPRTSSASLVLLLIALAAAVLLARTLSKPLETARPGAGLPQAFVGVVIAGVVLLPEGMAAMQATSGNRLQSSMNLALGSAVASIGLTIPAVVSRVIDRPLLLGFADKVLVLRVLTLFVRSLVPGTGRTTVLQGAVHLSIFVIFLLLLAVP